MRMLSKLIVPDHKGSDSELDVVVIDVFAYGSTIVRDINGGYGRNRNSGRYTATQVEHCKDA
jgi:hypothetical protein